MPNCQKESVPFTSTSGLMSQLSALNISLGLDVQLYVVAEYVKLKL